MDLETLGRGKYLSLTTFRRDGTAVATPVWLVRDGQSLRVITDAGSGKAKRLRVNPAVLLAPCDMRGNVKGDAVAGHALLQSPSDTAVTATMIARRYGLMGRILTWRDDRRARRSGSVDPARVGIVITLDGPVAGAS
jgi:uncharacterized protein